MYLKNKRNTGDEYVPRPRVARPLGARLYENSVNARLALCSPVLWRRKIDVCTSGRKRTCLDEHSNFYTMFVHVPMTAHRYFAVLEPPRSKIYAKRSCALTSTNIQ